MRLNEIESINYIKKNSYLFGEIRGYWDYSRYKVIGVINQFQIRYYEEYLGYGSGTSYYALYDKTKNKYALFMDMDKFGKTKNCFQIGRLGVDNPYQGLNLPARLYSWIIKNKNIILLSGYSQSPGGKAVWEKLANMPGIYMFGYNTKTKTAFQIDKNDMFNEDIYTDELDKEIDYLRNEHNRLENMLDNLHNTRDFDTPTQSNQLQRINTAIKELDDEQTKIDNKIEKFEYDIGIIRSYIRLVAIKTPTKKR